LGGAVNSFNKAAHGKHTWVYIRLEDFAVALLTVFWAM
jgi:hypothetical protein